MNTKSVLGIIIVIIIVVLVVIWLRKTPPTPAVPSDQTVPQNPATSSVSTTQNPATSGTSAPLETTNPNAQPQPAAAPEVSKKTISTTMKDGMEIQVTKEGSGPAIVNGQTAAMLYTGKLSDGSVFDASANHGNQPFEFKLGAGEVIKGWDEGIVGMKVGEERTLIIPANLAYGAAGHPPVIPENATLTFDVTLVGIK